MCFWTHATCSTWFYRQWCLLQAYPAQAPSLLEAGLIQLLGTLFVGKESAVVVAASFGVFARLLVHNGPAFVHLFQRAAAVMPAPAMQSAAPAADPSQALLLAYLDLWCASTVTPCAEHLHPQKAHPSS